MQRTAALIVLGILLVGCGPSSEDITRLACIKVLRWNNDPSSRSEVFESTLDLYQDAQDGEVEGEQTWENLIRMFTEEDDAALATWEESEPCQEAKQEVLEEENL